MSTVLDENSAAKKAPNKPVLVAGAQFTKLENRKTLVLR